MSSGFSNQVCVDYKSRCVNIRMYNHEGRIVYSERYCGIELVDIEGVTRMLIGDTITHMLCVNVESSGVEITQTGSTLKIR